MTIREIFDRQRETRGSDLYIIQQGMFYHAFNECAEFLSSCTGYQVRTLYTPHGDTYQQLGFPISSLDKVIKNVQKKCPHTQVFTEGFELAFNATTTNTVTLAEGSSIIVEPANVQCCKARGVKVTTSLTATIA